MSKLDANLFNTQRAAFSLMEVIMAMAVFMIVLGAVMESIHSTNSLRKQTDGIIKIKQDSRTVLEWMVDGVGKGKIINVNRGLPEYIKDVDTGEIVTTYTDYTEYSSIEWTPYSHDPITDEVIYSANQEMSYDNMKQMFPELSEDYRGDLTFLPDTVNADTKLDPTTFKGFFVVYDEENGVCYFGMTLLSEENGTEVIANYTEKVVVRQDINQE